MIKNNNNNKVVTKSNSQKEEIVWVYSSEQIKVHHGRETAARRKHVGKNEKQRCQITTMRTRQRRLTENDIGIFIYSLSSIDALLPAKLHHLHLLKQSHRLGRVVK